MTRRGFIRLCAAFIAAQIGGSIIGESIAETIDQGDEEPP